MPEVLIKGGQQLPPKPGLGRGRWGNQGEIARSAILYRPRPASFAS